MQTVPHKHTNDAPDEVCTCGDDPWAELKRLADKMSVGVCVVGREFQYVWANVAMAELLRVPRENLIGQSVLDFTHEDDRELDSELSQQAFNGEAPFFSLRKRYIRGDGSILVGDLFASVIFDDHGLGVGVAVLVDAMDADPVTLRLEQMQRSADAGQMAAGLAHNVKNAITVIRWGLDALPGQGSDQVQSLTDHLKHTVALADSVAGYADRPERIADAYDIGDLVRQSEGVITMMASPGTILLFETANVNARVRMNPSEFQQVLINLVKNAIEATRESGGRITISTRFAPDAPGFIDTCVTDEGCGMSAGLLAKIFEPYYTEKGSAGTGLGLAISRNIVERNGGSLLATSQEGHGSQLHIRLPTASQ